MATAPTAPTPQGEEPDPSMDDILASIRRILNEDEKTASPASPATTGVLVLDPSMIVEDVEHQADAAPMEAPPAPAAARQAELHPVTEEPFSLATMDDPVRGEPVSPDIAPAPFTAPMHEPPRGDIPLVAPAAAAAAAQSLGSLARTLAAERSAAVTRGGLTIEDLVREEVRPVLKEWLDAHLPPLVERMVRAELERVVGRSV